MRFRGLVLVPSVLVLAALGLAPAGAGERPARTFEVRYRSLDEAYALISPLLSDDADVRIVRASRRIELRDEAARLTAVEAALRGFDVEAHAVRLNVRVVKAWKKDGPGASVEASRGVPRDVREMLGYNVFETLGAFDLTLREGASATELLDDEGTYRVDLELGPVDVRAGSVTLQKLSLLRRLVGNEGRATYRPVFEFSERLEGGKAHVVCATPSAADRRALFLILTGTID